MDKLPTVPVLGLTATATPAVEADVVKLLRFTAVIRASTNRPNLSYNVRPQTTVEKDLLPLFRPSDLGAAPPTVVYAATKVRVEELTAALKAAGVSVESYHADKPTAARRVGLREPGA